MILVDSHCHLNFPEFREEMDAVVTRAREAGVRVMQTICTKMHEFADIRAIAERYEDVWCSVGVHPHEAEHHAEVTAETIVEKTGHPKVIGIGETGLDYYYEHSPREIQQVLFRRHIAAGRETGLPLIIHTRNADEDTAAILKEEMKKGPFTGLLHCFSSSQALAEEAVALGIYVSFSGILTFKKSDELRAIAKTIPMDRLLVETDAPFLAPMPYRGKRNEPAFTRHVNAMLAELKGISEEESARVTTENFFRLFKKPTTPI